MAAAPPAHSPLAAQALAAIRPAIKMGRPSVLTQEVSDLLCGLVARGNYLETAAHSHGLPIQEVRDWLYIGARLQRGLDPHPTRIVSPSMARACLDFSVAMQKANAGAELQAHDRLVQWGEKDWMAHMSRMERRWPKRWSRPAQRVELTGANGGPVESTLQLTWPGRAGLVDVEGQARTLPEPSSGEPRALPDPSTP